MKNIVITGSTRENQVDDKLIAKNSAILMYAPLLDAYSTEPINGGN